MKAAGVLLVGADMERHERNDGTMPPMVGPAGRELRASEETELSKSAVSRGPRLNSDVDVLVVAWCPHEPERVGEVTVIAPGEPRILGRGDGEQRARFFRVRPGPIEPQAPFASPTLSRLQAEVWLEAGGMRVRRLGRGKMRSNGHACEEALLQPGDTLGFGQSLLLLYVRRAASLPALRHFDRARVGPFGAPDAFGWVGESPAAWALRERLAFAAKSNAHVLIAGESGTGKELAARAIRMLSSRPEAPFVARNAATLPAGLIDAELFGNVKNYPNPGMVDRPGIIGEAHQGFLFLDEIGEMPSELQAHLLRVLDSGGEYQRLGETVTKRSQFRLIAATNRAPSDLKDDFLARLTVRVDVPALSERREDIPSLIHHLVERAAKKSPNIAERFLVRRAGGGAAARVDASFVETLVRREFALNTRDLEGLLWEAMAESDGDTIVWRCDGPAVASASTQRGRRRSKTRNPTLDAATIREALAHADGSVALAAKDLKLTDRHALYRRMKKLGVSS